MWKREIASTISISVGGDFPEASLQSVGAHVYYRTLKLTVLEYNAGNK